MSSFLGHVSSRKNLGVEYNEVGYGVAVSLNCSPGSPKLPNCGTRVAGSRFRRSLLHNPVAGRKLQNPLRPLPGLDTIRYFCKYRNMVTAQAKKPSEQIARYADMVSAMGTEARHRIMQLLLSAHPEGLVVGEIQEELEIPNSTLSHHLDKLRNEGLVEVKRESTFLRYTADTEALQEILQFLYAECCTRNKALKPQDIVQLCK